MTVVACECRIRGGFEKVGFGKEALESEILFKICSFRIVLFGYSYSSFVTDQGLWFRGSTTGWFGALFAVIIETK